MPGLVGWLALIEPLVLIGIVVWGYCSIRTALKQTKTELPGRILHELHNGARRETPP